MFRSINVFLLLSDSWICCSGFSKHNGWKKHPHMFLFYSEKTAQREDLEDLKGLPDEPKPSQRYNLVQDNVGTDNRIHDQHFTKKLHINISKYQVFTDTSFIMLSLNNSPHYRHCLNSILPY